MTPAFPQAWRLAPFAAALLLASAGHATSVPLSQASTDETDPAVLTATVDFQISGPSELTLTVSNGTSDPFAFDLDEVFFNGSSDVAGLTLVSASDGEAWKLNAGNTKAGGFGHFDFKLSGSSIAAGDSVMFVLGVSGSGPYDMADFVESGADCSVTSARDPGDCETFSRVPPGDQITQVAVKFMRGPGDDSAYGGSNGPGQPALIPEPQLFLLLGASALLMASWSRRGRDGPAPCASRRPGSPSGPTGRGTPARRR
jgi:hypothetical protein